MPQLLVFALPSFDLAECLPHIQTQVIHLTTQFEPKAPTLTANPEEIWVNADGEAITIEQVRDLLSALSYGASRLRVVYLLVLEKASEAAQQALLKTLEEPPPNTQFIITTHQVEALLPTIRSRCIEVVIAPDSQPPTINTQHAELLSTVLTSSVGQAVQVAESISDRDEARALVLSWLTHTTSHNHTSTRAPHLRCLLATWRQLNTGVNVKLALADLAIKLNQSVV